MKRLRTFTERRSSSSRSFDQKAHRERRTDREKKTGTAREDLLALETNLKRCSLGQEPDFKRFNRVGKRGEVKTVDRLWKETRPKSVFTDNNRFVERATAGGVGSRWEARGVYNEPDSSKKSRKRDGCEHDRRITFAGESAQSSRNYRSQHGKGRHRNRFSTAEESDQQSDEEMAVEEAKGRTGKKPTILKRSKNAQYRTVLSTEDEDESMSDSDRPRKNYPKTSVGKRHVTQKKENPTDRGIRIKLEKYDGKTAIAAFLAKFEVCARCNRWSDQEKADQLMCALTGPASQLLWDMGAQRNITWQVLVERLKARYGSEDQTSLYRIKLRTYRQAHGETLSNVVQEIRRLMALAYPGPTSDIVETVACDAFIDALANQDLAQKVREREPASLEAAYKHAVRLDAYGRSSTQGSDMDRRHGRVKVTWEDRKPLIGNGQPALRIEDLEREIKNLSKEIGRFTSKQDSGTAPRKPYEKTISSDSAIDGAKKNEQTAVPRRSFQPGRWKNPDIECFLCKQKGHVKRFCPQRTSDMSGETRINEPTTKAEPIQEQAQSRLVKGSRMAYVVARLDGKRLHCLLDSGSEMSLVPRRLVLNNEVTPSEQRLLAANGSEIKVDGETTLKIHIGKQVYPLPCLVTDQVSEVILGLSWLESNQARWDFASRCVCLGSEKIPLKEAAVESMCRRVVVQEDTVVPPRSEVDVPASVVYPHFQEDNEDWTTMPTELSPDLIIGRTLVTGKEPKVWIRMLNVGDRDSLVKRRTECLLERVELVHAAVRQVKEEDGSTRDRASSKIYMTAGMTEQTVEPEAEEVLKRLWEEVPADVSEDERRRIRELVLSYRTTFSLSEKDHGFTSVIQHEIDTQQEKPVRQPLRRQPLSMLPEIDRQVEDMLKQGIVEPSMSEWASNVVMVKKKDGSMRFCIDYRQLNLKTRKDAHPLPLIRESLDTLGGARWYSTFDLRSGYHQMALHPRDKHKTGFVTRRGSFQFKVLPFGLCNSPASFCRLMNLVLTGLNYDICLVYLDDIIVFSRDVETHMQRLEMVFRRLQEYNLKLKPSKCHLLQQRVLFLGHVLSEEGVATDPSKIKAVEEWVVPRNLRQVRSFIGLCSYYRRFIHDFAVVAQPLHFLTRKNVPFCWTDECQQAFEELKRRLVSSPILALPADEGQYILDTDASAYAIGAVLSQVQEGQEKVISYASRLLSTAERNYNVTRRELLAVIYFLKEFRQYILGRKFLLRTDHSALQWLRRTPEPIGQQARWLEIIEEFDFEIRHRAGAKHGNADAMSRGPAEEQYRKDVMKESTEEVMWVRPIEEITPSGVNNENAGQEAGWTKEMLRREQQSDCNIGPVLSWKESNHHPTQEELLPSSEEVKVLVSNWNQLEVRQGVLHRGWVQGSTGEAERYQLIVPIISEKGDARINSR